MGFEGIWFRNSIAADRQNYAAGSRTEMNDSMEVESIKVEIDIQTEDRRVVNVDSCSQTERSSNNEGTQTEMMTYEDVGDANVDSDSQTDHFTGKRGHDS
ncbi:hypothetical protein BJ742DRAFT_774794 [Cladochytrium replicatum]|nr:hypothetical protein BJ742DRAFT_774794 [Cladochytrium replicatum]